MLKVAKEAVPLCVTLPKVDVPAIKTCATPELKSTVLVAPVNVPLFVQLPLTPKVFVPVIVRVAPLLIVILLHTAPAAPIVGWNVVPDKMVTFVALVGTPPHQLDAVNQLLSVMPSQVPVAPPVPVTLLVGELLPDVVLATVIMADRGPALAGVKVT